MIDTAENLDSFLIGDGSAKLMDSYNEVDAYANQIIAEDESGTQLVIYDDIEDHVDPALEVRVETREEVDWAFHEYKKEVYDVFGYVELKSSWMRGVPIKIEDLVFDDADKYLIDYLIDSVTDLYTWKQLAKLQACANMGIAHVRFVTNHDCPLCKSATGKIMSVENLLRLLCRGGYVTHRLCHCDLVPVVYRETYSGPLTGHLEESLVTWGGHEVRNAPRELLADPEIRALVGNTPHSKIEFVNMPAWCAEKEIDDFHGLVVHVTDETLFVHNSYVGFSTPVDYLRGFLQEDAATEQLDTDTLKGAPAYWLDGEHVVKHNGHYYSADEGKRIK